MIAGGMTRKDNTSVAELVVGPMTFNSGVEEMRARANKASTTCGVEAASKMTTEQKRSIRDPARRDATIPREREINQAINNAHIANTTVRNKGSRMRLHTGECKMSESPRSPRAASATQFR